MRLAARRGMIVAVLTLLALAATACGASGVSDQASSPSPSTAPPWMSASPSPGPCSVAFLLPWFKSFADDAAIDLEIVDVDVVACENGYAHVYAVPYNDPGGAPPQYESEQFWLKLVDGEWTSVASGTGITCSDTDRTPEHAAACDALGES